MAFLTPLFLVLGLISVPIILMYMLRLRRKEVLVSSTLLWERLLKDRQANTPWQRLRRNLLLLLQLLILLALVLALARPFFPVPNVVSGSVVVLLDGSASMWSTDVEPDRFTQAKVEAGELISNLKNDGQMTLILVGSTPTVLASASNDKEQLLESLSAAEAERGPVDWEAAFALAIGAAQGFDEAEIVLISDGGLPDDLPSLPGAITYVPIGESGENIAVSSLSIRHLDTGSQLFGQVNNYGQQEQDVIVSLEVDGALFDSKRLTIGAGDYKADIWELSEDIDEMTMRISGQESDFQPLDDLAWAVSEDSGVKRVLLVSEGNRFLETVLSLYPNIDLFLIQPEEFDSAAEESDFDLYILDDTDWPVPMPSGDALLIHPSQPTAGSEEEAGVSFSEVFSQTRVTALNESPLHQFVDWGRVNIRSAVSVAAPWLQTVVTAEGGPLLLVGERGGHRTAVLTFRLQDSDLPLQIAFPVLVSNLLEWLNPGGVVSDPQDLRPNEAVVINPGQAAETVAVYLPDGSLWLEESEGQPVLFGQSDQPGIYRVGLRTSEGEQDAGRFAINLFSDLESNIVPVNQLQLGTMEVDPGSQENQGQRELWPFLAAAAIIILILEWWIYHRGCLNFGRFRTES